MIKRTSTETIYEYDDNGKMVRKVVTETTEEDTNVYWPSVPSTTFGPDGTIAGTTAVECPL